MPSIADILLQYRELCSYCDSFLTRIRTLYPNQIVCAERCADCCTLKTACALEAYNAAIYIKRTSAVQPAAQIIAASNEGICAFLHNRLCAIYPARPIICRSHGLAVIIPGESAVDCCPLNFRSRSVTSVKKSDIMDITRLTTNLMRLNFAFCTVLKDPQLSGRRIRIADIAAGDLPEKLREIIDKNC